MLERLGFRYSTVAEQEVPDGRFPTVKSPNPENAEALSRGIAQAQAEGADLVIATDPDCDRMGVAVRNRAGEMELFTGNQIGSLMAYYRVKTLIAQGVLTPENARNAVIIKTFVTTDLQKAIAERNGLRCVETLTGFKYIGEKLGKYEKALPAETRDQYRTLSEEETRQARLAHSSYYVCGGEESYGYSAADFMRDKDGNGATVVFAEVAAYAKSRGLTLPELLDEVYAEYGYYLEKNGSLTFEGAEGAMKIAKLVASYAQHPPVSRRWHRGVGGPQLRDGDFPRRRGRQDSQGKHDHDRAGGWPPHRRPAERHRAEDQVLHVRQPHPDRRQALHQGRAGQHRADGEAIARRPLELGAERRGGAAEVSSNQ